MNPNYQNRNAGAPQMYPMMPVSTLIVFIVIFCCVKILPLYLVLLLGKISNKISYYFR